MPALPSGTITFLFTDIEGSTTHWERQPVAMQQALTRHDTLVRAALTTHHGQIFKAAGDAFCAAFTRAPDAIAAAIAAQHALQIEPWPPECNIRVRMALHTGTAEERDGDYFGPTLNRVARLLAAGYGSQILVSGATHELVRDALPDPVGMLDLGTHPLKDLTRPEHIFQVTAPDLRDTFPSLRTLHARPNNLPVQRSQILGRADVLQDVTALIQRPDVGLVTLTGVGGTGKTRLALQLAADLLDDFPDGVWFVDLAPLTDSSGVLGKTARTLGVHEQGGQAIADGLAHYLRDKHVLIVLDNFEHVLDAAPSIGELLRTAPNTKVIVTSRVCLRIRDEQEYPVPPLPVAELTHGQGHAELKHYAAVQLFIERARAVNHNFQVTNETATAVAEICARLDGLPLAIELAAAHSKLFTPQALLRRLDQRLALLTDGAHDLPARQQTLRRSIDWSYQLLTPAEQHLFAHLSVFAGGWTLEAVQRVCVEHGERDVTGILAALVDKNLIQQHPGSDDEPRFTMLETIREYAANQLTATGASNITRERHARYFLALAETAEPQQGQPLHPEPLQRLAADYANVHAALEWSLHHGALDTLLRLCGALGSFWSASGRWSEGHAWLQLAVAHSEDALTPPMSPTTRVRVVRWAAMVAADVGDYDVARSQTEQALELYQTLSDHLGVATQLDNLAYIASRTGDVERAHQRWEELLVIYRELGAHGRRANVLNSLGWYWLCQGDTARATRLLEESVADARKTGEQAPLIHPLSSLGMAQLEAGDLAAASATFAEGLRLAAKFRHMESIQGFLEGYGALATRTSSPRSAVRAARLLGAAASIRHALGLVLSAYDNALRERYFPMARAKLTPSEWETAWNEGASMPLEHAVGDALAPSDDEDDGEQLRDINP